MWLKKLKISINEKISHILGLEGNTGKMARTPKLVYLFNIIPTRMAADFFVKTDKRFLEFTWN